jgi:hypothetical protein
MRIVAAIRRERLTTAARRAVDRVPRGGRRAARADRRATSSCWFDARRSVAHDLEVAVTRDVNAATRALHEPGGALAIPTWAPAAGRSRTCLAW